MAKVMEITLRFGERDKEAVCLVCSVCSLSGINALNISQAQLAFLPFSFLSYRMDTDNLKDMPSSLLSCQCETFNIIPGGEKKATDVKNELPFTFNLYLILKMSLLG